MSRFLDLYRSDLGKKAVMAVTGVMLFGFVLGHMAGNLKLYLGAEELNHYAEWLREIGQPLLPPTGILWIARVGLLVAVVAHMTAAIQLTRTARKARRIDYTKRNVLQATYASRTARWGGVIIALFVAYHLAHFTWGWVHPDFIAGDVYHNVISGFRVPWVAALYVVANVALGLHLYHGLWSMFQTVGWAKPDRSDWRRTFALAFAVVVTAGNISFPVSVVTGLVGG